MARKEISVNTDGAVDQSNEVAESVELMVQDLPEVYLINDQIDYNTAWELQKAIKEKAKEIEEIRKSITVPLDTAKKAVMDLFRKPQDVLVKARALVEKGIGTYDAKKREEERKEQARLDAAAKKKADALAEKARLAREAGKEDKAEALEEKAEAVAAPVVVPKVEKPKGSTIKKVWKFKVVDVNLIPRGFMTPDTKAIGEYARATKGKMPVVGIEFYSENSYI